MGTVPEPYPELLSLSVHELRSPITVAAGYVRMLLRGQSGELTDRQRKLLEETERSCGRLSELIGQMSDLANLDAGTISMQLQDVNLCSLVAEAAAGVSEGADRGITVEVRGGETGMIVVGDRGRLKAALGAIIHSVLRDKIEPSVVIADCAVRTEDGGRRAVIRIGDERHVALLDRPRERGAFDEYRGGMGLALPIARRVIDAHGGSLWSSGGDENRTAAAVALPLKA